MFSVCDNLFVDFFANIVTVLLCCTRHPVNIYLEFLLWNFEPFFLFFIVFLQVLLCFAILGTRIAKHRLLSLVIFKIEIIKALVFFWKCRSFAQSRQVFKKGERLTIFFAFLFWISLIVLFWRWVGRWQIIFRTKWKISKYVDYLRFLLNRSFGWVFATSGWTWMSLTKALRVCISRIAELNLFYQF
jgi:hypothetical protein